MKKVLWIIFATLSILVGLYPFIYFVIDRHFGLLSSKSEIILSNTAWNIGFYGHIVFGGLALIVGWMQFSKKLRNRNIERHKLIGKFYVIFVLVSGLCSLYIALYATGGNIAKTGFFILGVLWLYFTTMAFFNARNGLIKKHQKNMIFSYAACFAAVTLRIWLPILISIFGDFIIAYKIVAWLCWVPNIIIAYFIARKV